MLDQFLLDPAMLLIPLIYYQLHSSTPPDHPMRNWPCKTEQAKADRNNLIGTHCVIPLPAYDATKTGRLIDPKLYHEALPGALIRVYFTSTHFFISNKNIFVADVTSIHVLVSPPLLEQHLTVICGLAQRQFPRYKSKHHGLTQRQRQG